MKRILYLHLSVFHSYMNYDNFHRKVIPQKNDSFLVAENSNNKQFFLEKSNLSLTNVTVFTRIEVLICREIVICFGSYVFPIMIEEHVVRVDAFNFRISPMKSHRFSLTFRSDDKDRLFCFSRSQLMMVPELRTRCLILV